MTRVAVDSAVEVGLAFAEKVVNAEASAEQTVYLSSDAHGTCVSSA